MANEEQLNILKQGVHVWDKWRIEHPAVRPDLEGMKWDNANLYKANLQHANLRGANLYKAFLRGADLQEANLQHAFLLGADLQEANLQHAFLLGADLQEADLQEATLPNTDLRKANLRNAILMGATLFDATLRGADLLGANLRGARLYEVDLRNANLSFASLIYSNFSEANITGCCLYGTARDDWTIYRIQCDYVYWDRKGKERTPKNRDFRPGEFEELYKHLPTFEYYFEHGFTPIDAVVMDRVVQAINEKQPEIELKLDSFHSRGMPHAVFTVLHKESIEDAQKQVKENYESRLAALEGKQEQMMDMFSALLSRAELPPAPAADDPEHEAIKEELKKVRRKLNDTLPGSLEEQALLKEMEILNNKLQGNG